jgi:TolB protein
MAVVGNDGVTAQVLPPPGPLTDCAPVRWWSSTVILAECTHGKQEPGTFPDYSSQLWQIPLTGGAPTALTAVNTGTDPGFGGDLGDADAWQLPSGTFLQSAGGCSTGFLSRLTADKHTTPVTVPGVATDRSVFVIGANADTLVLQATMACGPGVSLLTYDPVANTSTVLLGPPVNGGGVQGAIIRPGR